MRESLNGSVSDRLCVSLATFATFFCLKLLYETTLLRLNSFIIIIRTESEGKGFTFGRPQINENRVQRKRPRLPAQLNLVIIFVYHEVDVNEEIRDTKVMPAFFKLKSR